jgi:hypothetical protein
MEQVNIDALFEVLQRMETSDLRSLLETSKSMKDRMRGTSWFLPLSFERRTTAKKQLDAEFRFVLASSVRFVLEEGCHFTKLTLHQLLILACDLRYLRDT